MTKLQKLAFVFTLATTLFSCAPGTQPSGVNRPPCGSRSNVAAWSDCRTRCLPDEQLYAQCTSKLGVVFSTRSGLLSPQMYGYTLDPEAQCGGVPSARIWRLTRIDVTRATAGYMSLPSVSTPDCARAYLQDLSVEPDRFYYSGVDVTAREAAYLDSMSTAITPAPPTQIVQTFNAPADGDIANAASVNVAFQSLENSVEALRFLTYGGGFYPRVKATSNTVMTIQPLGAVVVKQLGVWTAVPHSVATTIDPLALAGGAFAANTRYYVYVNLVAGVITWSVSTTAPDAGYRYKTGDEQYQFISTFYTDSALNLLPYSQSDKTYIYQNRTPDGLSGAIDGNLVVYRVTASGTRALGGAVPTGARSVNLMALVVTGGTAFSGAVGPSGANPLNSYFTAPITSTVSVEFSCGLASGTSIDYAIVSAPTYMNIWVTGFIV